MARAPAIQEVEPVPEADRLEGAPHPRETLMLYGHEAAESQLAQTFASGRMHHGWMMSGQQGIGKATLAYRFARHILARPEERDPGHPLPPLASAMASSSSGDSVMSGLPAWSPLR